nr:hypothetical protein [uncultured Halomonas sp.]
MNTTERVALDPHNPEHEVPEGYCLYASEIAGFFFVPASGGGVASDDYPTVAMTCAKARAHERFIKEIRAKLRH